MPEIIEIGKLDSNFKYVLSKEPGGENIKLCFACGICTAGCPVSEIDEEYSPRKIIRMVLLGMKKEVLSSDFIWLCVLCYTCQAHCPQDVKFTDIMGALRNIAVREGYVHPSFLQKIDEIGKQTQKVRHDMIISIVKKKKEENSDDVKELLKKIVSK